MLNFLKKIIRTLISFFPFLRDVASITKTAVRGLSGSTVEEDFNVIDLFPNDQELVFLDVGGNRGFIIDVMLRKNKHCKIYSFEPNPEIYKHTNNRFRNNPRVKMYNFGLGEQLGAFKLYVPVYRGYIFDGLGSLSPQFDDTWLASTLLFYNKNKLYIREFVCEIKRLDDLNLNPFFMKVDVEGAELSVINGSLQTISTSHPIILIESGNQDIEILNLLSRFGYRMYRYEKGTFIEGESGSPNTFFITDEKYELILG